MFGRAGGSRGLLPAHRIWLRFVQALRSTFRRPGVARSAGHAVRVHGILAVRLAVGGMFRIAHAATDTNGSGSLVRFFPLRPLRAQSHHERQPWTGANGEPAHA